MADYLTDSDYLDEATTYFARYRNLYLHRNCRRSSACQWPKRALLVEVTLTVTVGPKDYVAAVSRLPAEVICWSQTFDFGIWTRSENTRAPV